jgi:membrane-bound serine protease (ClpP class)
MLYLTNKRIVFAFFVLLFSLLATVHWASFAGESSQKVYVIPVSGEVEPAMAAFIKRAFRDTANEPTPLYVLEMDTFGGRVDSALQIVDTLINVPKGKTIAYVKTKAISAGALIALSCDVLYMKPGTTIGDCAPITYGGEGPKMMGEKFQSPLRAKFRTLAKRNGYSETLAESMVTAEMVVYEVVFPDKTVYLDQQAFDDLPDKEKKRIVSKKTVVAQGELLTMHDIEAHDLGFSKMSAASIDEVLKKQGIENYEIINFKSSWSESLGRFIGTISPILMLIGLAALYMELKAPGFGVPGILGISCLALVFLNQYLIGLADHSELLLILIGISFLGVELFVTPGFGVMGLAGLGCIAAGMILSFQDFVIPDPSFPWQKEIFVSNMIHVFGSYLFAFVISILFLKYVFPRLGTVIDGPYLFATLENSRAHSEEAKGLKVGDKGIVTTSLRPSGKAEIDGEIHDVIAEGEFMDKGSKVEVLKIMGNRVIVIKGEA